MSEINDIKELPEGNFPINLKLIQIYQRLEPSILAKYENGTYQEVSFCGVINIDISLIMCKDKIGIPSKLQSYILYWYHTHILHPGMDITEALILQNLYWPDIIDAVRKEVTNFETCQRTKQSNKKYGILPNKLAEEITWNKLCVYIIGPHAIRRKVQERKLTSKIRHNDQSCNRMV